MKKGIFLLIGFLISGMAFSQSAFPDAVSYNDFIVGQQNLVGEAITDLMDNIDSDSVTLWTNYHTGARTTEECLQRISSLPGYNGNTEFRDASIALFTFYRDVFANEYYQVIKIYASPDFVQEDFDQLQKIMDSIVEKESALDDRFASAEGKFALDNNFTLVGDADDE